MKDVTDSPAWKGGFESSYGYVSGDLIEIPNRMLADDPRYKEIAIQYPDATSILVCNPGSLDQIALEPGGEGDWLSQWERVPHDDEDKLIYSIPKTPVEGVDYQREGGDGTWRVDRIEEVGAKLRIDLFTLLERWRFNDGSVQDLNGTQMRIELTGDDLVKLYDAMIAELQSRGRFQS